MIFLLASIASSIGLFVVFRLFEQYNIHTRVGIMINYLVASLLCFALTDSISIDYSATWFWASALFGIFFYLVFSIMAKVTRENGVSVASMASKMSLIIPVLSGLLILQEQITMAKIVGIIIGGVSIFAIAGKREEKGSWLFPVILFFGSGITDMFIKLFEAFLLNGTPFLTFCGTVFGFAFLSALIHQFKQLKIHGTKAIPLGTLLGIVNVAALFFLIKAVSTPSIESSIAFPLNNFGIISGSSIVGFLVFKERLTRKQWVGIALGLLAILILTFA